MTSRSTSPSEGEIIETDSEKATRSLPTVNGNHVDLQSRKHRSTVSRSPSPAHSQRSHNYRPRSHSPYREPRGSKRFRQDNHCNDQYDRSDRRDSRSFRIHYEDRHADGERHYHSSYRDHDHPVSSSSGLRYDDRQSSGRPREKRLRTVSRSPPRFSDRKPATDTGHVSKKDNQREGSKRNARATSTRGQYSREQSVSERGSNPNATASSRPETEQKQNQSRKSVSFKFGTKFDADNNVRQSGGDDASNDDPTKSVPLTEAELIEQRRKRREAIKAKHKGQGSQDTPLLVQVLDPGKSALQVGVSPDTPSSPSEGVESLKIATPAAPHDRSGTDSPSNFDPHDDADLANSSARTNEQYDDGPSAADYDPTADMQEDKRREGERHHGEDVTAGAYDETKSNKQDVLIRQATAQEAPPEKKAFDMFADEEDDDMFADPSAAAKVTDKPDATMAVPVPRAALDMSMLDDWDDEEGYYKVIIGELLDNRYHVQMNLGKGMFSGVVRAMDQITQKLVAIKLIRSNETMRKAAMKEIDILKSLGAADPEDKKHMIRLERQFEHKGHLCMVFENLSINLREVLKKFGHGVGINLKAVRAYAQQMFLGLTLLRKCNILHADLKPDNVLVNDSRALLKICDLGSASDASENEITPYLVSRFYRAPEIILGMEYTFAIDMWSVGCTLFELYTGKILFTGRNNNQMLRSIMECRGKFSHKVLKKAQYAPLHFDELLNFRSQEKDKLTGKEVVRVMTFNKPTRDLRTRLVGGGAGGGAGADGKGGVKGGSGLSEAENKELGLFVDLLDKCLALNPERRCTPAEALRHPFIMKGK